MFDAAIQENLKLKDDLRTLQGNTYSHSPSMGSLSLFFLEQYNPRHSPWSCELCTFINRPFSETGSDVCEVCESPSPLKRGMYSS